MTNATTLQLKQPHTDAGRAYQAGDRLEVDETTARWLVEHGIAESTQPAQDATPATGRPARATTATGESK